MPQIFAAYYTGEDVKGWKDLGKELEGLLDHDEWTDARNSTINAHFTAIPVVRGMWKAVDKLGLKEGRIIEPALGSGYFFGLMDPAMKGSSRLTGVEMDSVTGRIARQLYQSADVRTEPYQETKVPDNFFDLAISNVPFSDTKILEDRRYRQHRFLSLIHI